MVLRTWLGLGIVRFMLSIGNSVLYRPSVLWIVVFHLKAMEEVLLNGSFFLGLDGAYEQRYD